MARILITGGFGFVGSSLAKRCCAAGHEVTLITRSVDKLRNVDGLPCRSVVKDVCHLNQSDVDGVDFLFHCASTVDNYNILDNPYLDANTNCLGTLSLLESCRKVNPDARIVFPSTFFVNGNLRDLPATPDSPCNPLGLYGATKLAAEHFCRIYHSVYGLNTVIVRLVNVFGVGEQRDNNKKAAFNRMIQTAVNDGTIELYDHGETRRDILYVDDAVEALLVASKHGIPGKVYYAGQGFGMKVGAFAEAAIEETGKGRIIGTEPPPFHRATGINDFWCDPSPLRELGWKPRISVREGIRRVIANYRGTDG